MRWREGRRSDNIEDRRGMGGKGLAVGGIGSVIIVALSLLLGFDPRTFLGGDSGSSNPAPGTSTTRPVNTEEEELKDFTSSILANTEDVWQGIFRRGGEQYRAPKLVLFTGRVQSPCGTSTAAVGPFYCPGDQKVYIDLSFYRELKSRFRAPGDFAQAYVIAHEVGHHVQNLAGIMDKVNSMQRKAGERESNDLSVRLELQADCYAGVWAQSAQKKGDLEAGDIEEALNAATAIGDDRLQKEGQGYVVPDSFTHGTSAQRQRWFRRGLETGDIKQCDSFNTRNP